MVEEIALTDAVSFLSSVNSIIEKSVEAAAAPRKTAVWSLIWLVNSIA